jgi:hypothetical protein
MVRDGQNWLRTASKTFLDICGVEFLGYFINRHVGRLTVCIIQHLHYIKHRKHGWRLINSFQKLLDLWQPSGSGHFLIIAQQPPVGQGLLNVEDSQSYSDTSHLLGLLWTSDQLVAENSTWQHTTLTTDRHPCSRRDSNTQSQQASGCKTAP